MSTQLTRCRIQGNITIFGHWWNQNEHFLLVKRIFQFIFFSASKAAEKNDLVSNWTLWLNKRIIQFQQLMVAGGPCDTLQIGIGMTIILLGYSVTDKSSF